MAANGASFGARQAQIISLVRHERRAFASSINAASFQIPQSLGPALAGPMIAAGFFSPPFYVAALLQMAYILGYRRVFKRFTRQNSLNPLGSESARE
jgi:predicted MFS family arabinose efflux permease